MRILVISNFYPPAFLGGYELKCRDQVQELEKRGHEIAVLTSRWQAAEGAASDRISRQLYFKAADLRAPADPSRAQRLRRRAEQAAWAVRCRQNYRITRDMIRQWRPEVAYIWNLESVSISPVLAAHDEGVPAVLRLGDYWLHRLKVEMALEPNPLKRQYRAVMANLGRLNGFRFNTLLFISQWTQARYCEAGIQADVMAALPEGMPLSLVLNDLPPAAPPDAPRLACVARLVPEKGVNVALEALAQIARHEGGSAVHLDIIGGGPEPYVTELKHLAARLGIAERVTFVGFIENREVLERLPRYIALLVPSLWEEPLGGVVVEGMARGVPVIATTCGGIPEIITDGRDGLLVPPGDVSALADAVLRLIRHPEEGAALRRAGLQTVREHFIHERIVDCAEDYLRRAVSQGSN